MSKKITLEFIKVPARFKLAYHVGEKGVFDLKQADELMDAGVAKKVEESDVSDLPEDLPGRQAILKSGLTLDELKDVKDFTQIEGIGKPTAEKLTQYFKN